jgi:hypothetical protein
MGKYFAASLVLGLCGCLTPNPMPPAFANSAVPTRSYQADFNEAYRRYIHAYGRQSYPIPHYYAPRLYRSSDGQQPRHTRYFSMHANETG